MEDAEADVRDWATFGLGVPGDQDSPEIRAALSRRLSDQNVDASEEALIGLAKRHDTSMLAHLMNELEKTTITDRVVEAANTLLGFDKYREDAEGEVWRKHGGLLDWYPTCLRARGRTA